MDELTITYNGPRWLKISKAADYASMSPRRLKALASDGVILGFPDPDDKRGSIGDGVWIFDRESIDSYRLKQANYSDTAIVQKALLATRRKRTI